MEVAIQNPSKFAQASTRPQAHFSPKKRKVWIVLPAFNEQDNLGKLMERIGDAMHEENRNYEVIVVDDGSSDHTREVAEDYRSFMPVSVLIHKRNLGLGATIRDGLSYAAARCEAEDIVIAMDADNTHSPGLMRTMIRCVNEGNDVVIASRYQPGSHVRGVPVFRQFLSLGASWLFRFFFPVRGVKDYTCGYRAYRGNLLKQAFTTFGEEFIDQDGFECMVDILIKLRELNALFREVPLVLRYDIKEGASKMKVARTIFRSLALVLNRRLNRNTTKRVNNGKSSAGNPIGSQIL